MIKPPTKRAKVSRRRAAIGFFIGVAAGAQLVVYWSDRHADGIANPVLGIVALLWFAIGLGVVLIRPKQRD